MRHVQKTGHVACMHIAQVGTPRRGEATQCRGVGAFPCRRSFHVHDAARDTPQHARSMCTHQHAHNTHQTTDVARTRETITDASGSVLHTLSVPRLVRPLSTPSRAAPVFDPAQSWFITINHFFHERQTSLLSQPASQQHSAEWQARRTPRLLAACGSSFGRHLR
jgi:hypothetical protein